MKNSQFLFLLVVISVAFLAAPLKSKADPGVSKEWSLLIYMNANNSLADFSVKDLNEMEVVGSDANINVVVQWASKDNATTKRLLMQKDQDPVNVTSPVVQEMARVDMGDPQSLVDFVKWGAENYPAKKYMVVVWNHGTGWHDLPAKDQHTTTPGSMRKNKFKRGYVIENISRDDFTKHSFSTVDLGQALQKSAEITGQKIELYGSDACSMASLEVVTEMKDSIRYFVGSEELEDDNGWPYDLVLQRLVAHPEADGLGLGRMLADAYLESAASGNSMGGVTLSVTDTRQLPDLLASMSQLSLEIQKFEADNLYEIWCAADVSQRFWYDDDFKDLGSFLENMQVTSTGITPALIENLKANLKKAIPYVVNSNKYTNATGLTLWVPPFNLIYDRFSNDYKALQFEKLTGWDGALQKLIRKDQGPY